VKLSVCIIRVQTTGARWPVTAITANVQRVERQCQRGIARMMLGMSGGTVVGDRERVQFLLWRAGMGATPAQVDAATAKGYAQAVEDLLAYPDQPAPPPTLPPFPEPPKDANSLTGDQRTQMRMAINQANQQGIRAAILWWTGLMRATNYPLQENLTLFWHNHFATANDKVRRPEFMVQQNQLLRTHGAGKFVDLLIGVSKDPAMLHWLDGQTNVKGHPNENWAREVMELFTLGIGNYTEQDVREAARASTGWTVAFDGTVTFVPKRFDDGQKTILGQTGNFNLDDFSRMLAANPTTARFVSGKLFKWFVGDKPADADLAPMIDTWNQSGGEIRSVLRALFLSDAFTPERAAGAHIKNPASWTVGAVRGLEANVADEGIAQMMSVQGMQLFYPPNVGGWPSGTAWISPSSQVLRFNLAAGIVTQVKTLTGKADDPALSDLADRLGGITLPDDLRAKLTALSSTDAGRRAAAQVILAGPAFQAR
jgi:uncharacterized protein (DUF1800 family)